MKKICVTCNGEKNLSEFRKDRSRKDGYRSSCKICDREYHRSKHQEKYGEKRAIRDRKKRDENRSKLTEIKRQNGCLCCDENEPICLEFHHTEPNEKEFMISAHTHRSWSFIEKELKKCVIVCSNCHKKIHAGLISLWSTG